jgi:chromosome segregation ATPase
MEAPPDDAYLGAQDRIEGMQRMIRGQKNSIEIPMKSPIREQATRLRDQELQFRAQADAMSLELDALRRENDQRGRMVSDLERRLERLNKTLRDVIVGFNPSKNSDYRQPPYGLTNGSDRAMEPGDMVASQLEYLSKGLSTIRQEQQSMGSQNDTVAEASAAVAMAQAEGRMSALNQQIKDLLLSVNARPPPPPNASDLPGVDTELDDQISYFQYALRVIETELIKANEAAANAPRNVPARGGAETEATLKELWNSLQSAFGNLQRQKEDRRRYLKEKGLEENDDDADMLDMFSPDDDFSVPGLVSRVRNLSGQLVKLSEQKAVLKRQVKQQRELNNKSDTEKDAEIQNKVAEIRAKEMEIQDKASQIRAKDSELQGKDSVIEAKDAELLEMDSKIFNLESRVKDLETELEDVRANGARSNINTADVEAKDAKVKELEAQVAETKSYLERAQSDASQTQGMLLSALRDLDTANKKSAAEESEAVQTARAELEEKRTKLSALETSSKDLESRLNMTETSRRELQERMDEIDGKIEALESELVEARAAKNAAEQAAEYKQKELDGKQREIKEKDDVVENMNLMVVELKTELTIAMAELEGAYGSRAERAADAAAIKSSSEVIELQDQINNLKTELEQTLKQLQDITAETIKAEQDKLEIEGKLDDAVAMRTSLETEAQELRDRLDREILESREKIGKLQEELDSQRLKVVPSGEGGARPGAGASMLSEQFRATMREERKKFQEDLRVSFCLYSHLLPIGIWLC